MRLFVAAALGPTVIAAAQAVIGQLKVRVETLAPDARITWIPAHLMHLTIRFIGEVPDDQGDTIASSFREPLAAAGFAVDVAGVGAFSSRGVPRVLWGGLRDGTAELRRVERLVSDRLQGLGIPPDQRTFTPHLTLGRVRDAGRLRTDRLLAGYGDVPFGRATVDAITLFQSRSSPSGPTYVSLQSTRLLVP